MTNRLQAFMDSDRGKTGGGNFVPNLYPPYGEIEIIFLSDMNPTEDGVPPIEIFSQYTAKYLADPSKPNRRFGQDFSWETGDSFHPEYERELEDAREQKAAGKDVRINPDKPLKDRGFAYVFNVTAYNAFNKDKVDPDRDYSEMENHYRTDSKLAERRDTYKGPMLLELPVGLISGMKQYFNTEMTQGTEEPSLRAYIFTLEKKKESNGFTSYTLKADRNSPLDPERYNRRTPKEIMDFYREVADGAIESWEDFYPLEKKVQAMRYRGEDGADDDVSGAMNSYATSSPKAPKAEGSAESASPPSPTGSSDDDAPETPEAGDAEPVGAASGGKSKAAEEFAW